MRFRIVPAVLAFVAVSCSSAPAPATSAQQLNCASGAVATITNQRNVSYDIYYQEGTTRAVAIGEVNPGSTITVPLPGTGRGRVYLSTANGYIPRSRAISETRIRVHCAG
jgi:hypothetical protein